jgi:hypothetical protein
MGQEGEVPSCSDADTYFLPTGWNLLSGAS